jgi:4-hydroxybenzoate polyprenyltransferase
MNSEPDPIARVIDAPSDNWVYRLLPRPVWPYAQLARWDRPIGWQLLLWPCFWSAALAANVAADQGMFDLPTFVWHLALFFAGAVAMRGAGCTYNDIVDFKIDALVARTRSRPLPSGRTNRKRAWLFLVAQALIGLLVLLQFNPFSIALGVSSLAVVAIYPFAKRFTDWPQFFLGLAFSWGGFMGWAAAFGNLSWAAASLYAAAVVWTIGYDTIYAHQDKDDDALIGVRSTALLFGDHTKQALTALYGLTALLLAFAFVLAGVAFPAWIGLAIATAMLFWQIRVIDISNADQCLALFRFNNPVGAILFAGLLLSIPL